MPVFDPNENPHLTTTQRTHEPCCTVFCGKHNRLMSVDGIIVIKPNYNPPFPDTPLPPSLPPFSKHFLLSSLRLHPPQKNATHIFQSYGGPRTKSVDVRTYAGGAVIGWTNRHCDCNCSYGSLEIRCPPLSVHYPALRYPIACYT